MRTTADVIFGAMIFLRMAGTPHTWHPNTAKTSRWTRRRTVLPMLVALVIGLVAFPIGPVIVLHDMVPMFEGYTTFSIVPLLVALIPMAVGGGFLWGGVREIFSPDAFLEIDHASRKLLVWNMRGDLPAQRYRGSSFTLSLDELGGLGTQIVEERTHVTVVNRSNQQYTRTEQVERLVAVPSGVVLWSDRPHSGRTGEIGRHLAQLTGHRVVRLEGPAAN